MNNPNQEADDANRDPITGEPGSHPVGTGIGSATGAVTGAAIGSVGGPIGAAVGGAIGAIAGGGAGHAVAEGVNPTVEDAYWEENFRNEPYYERDYDFNDYGPAYRYGYSRYQGRGGQTFEQSEEELSRGWDQARDKSRLGWDRARDAVRAGWHRVERAIPGDADHDGR
jgi:hypothetical protein